MRSDHDYHLLIHFIFFPCQWVLVPVQLISLVEHGVLKGYWYLHEIKKLLTYHRYHANAAFCTKDMHSFCINIIKLNWVNWFIQSRFRALLRHYMHNTQLSGSESEILQKLCQANEIERRYSVTSFRTEIFEKSWEEHKNFKSVYEEYRVKAHFTLTVQEMKCLLSWVKIWWLTWPFWNLPPFLLMKSFVPLAVYFESLSCCMMIFLTIRLGAFVDRMLM